MVAERAVESSSSTQASQIEAEVLSELRGPERYGRVRGYGIGVTPTQLSAVSRFTADVRDAPRDGSVRRLEAEIASLRETRDADRAEMALLRETRDADRAELASMRQTHDAAREADRAEMQAMRSQLEQLTSILHTFMPSQVPDISSTRRYDDSHPPADH